MTAGLIVVNRFQSLRRGAANRALKNRLPALGSSDEDVARRYRGFDGVVWPRPETPFVLDERDLAAPRDLEAVKAYRQKQDRPDECDLLLLSWSTESPPELYSLKLLGFDLGYFEAAYSHFSVILSDIIYGPIGDLRAVSVALNEHFLFSTAQEAQRIALQRSHLRDLGLDLEEGRMEPIALYG